MIEQLRKDLELKNEKILSMEETIHSLKNKLTDWKMHSKLWNSLNSCAFFVS